jgi:diaminopimelate epimerase
MPQEFRIPFMKLHGMGNDWIVTPRRGLPRALPAFARAILDRHTGVGADGLIPVLPPRDSRNDALVRFFNADGSEAEMSGNGIRCAGVFLLALGKKKRVLNIETVAGLKSLECLGAGAGKWIFRVGMGLPVLDPRKIPFRAPGVRAPVRGFALRTRRGTVQATVTSLGNPHCTVFVRDFGAVDWPSLGREIEPLEFFPNRTNVEFVKVISQNRIAVRFWERGVGQTMSSGTGSCAAVVASILNGFTGRRVRVRTEAGELLVAWPAGGEVQLTGPVERIAEGVYFYRRSRR